MVNFQNEDEIDNCNLATEENMNDVWDSLFEEDNVVSISDEHRQMLDNRYLKNEITSLDDKIQYMKESIPGFIACTSDLVIGTDKHKDSTLYALEMSFLTCKNI